MNSSAHILLALAALTTFASAAEPLWLSDQPVPKNAELSALKGVQFHVIKAHEPDHDGYPWLHGVALAWHKGKLYASFGHNKGRENTSGEEARGRVSSDGGKTWSETFTIGAGEEPNLGISHGAFLSRGGELWAFMGAFYGSRLTDIANSKVHTRAYRLNEATGGWEKKGTVIEGGFWPMQEPLKMDDGNWIMCGLRVGDGHPGAVAISHGDDLTKWDLVPVPRPDALKMWGESTVIVSGKRVQNFTHINPVPSMVATAVSEDYGRTWTDYVVSDLPMVRSKNYSGMLSTGQPYFIGTTTAEGATINRRSPLTIAVGRPGEKGFRKMFLVRDSVCPESPGDSDLRAGLSYPYAVEHDGNLYVGYSNSGARGGNNNSAELAVLPIASFDVHAPEPPKPTPSTSAQSWPLDGLDVSLKLHGEARPAAGAVGKSLVLDGNSVIELKDSVALNVGAEGFTFSVWFNPYAPTSGQQVIAGKTRYSSNERQWTLTVEPNGALKAFIQQTGWSTISDAEPLQAGHWHLAILSISADKAVLYRDGKHIGEAGLKKPVPATQAPVTLGGIADAGVLKQTFSGAVDEARFEPRVLSAEEIAASYKPVTATHELPKPLVSDTPLWDERVPLLKSAELPVLGGVEFHVIKKQRPDTDGAKWTLGVGLAWHKGKLYASYGFNKGDENTETEEAHVRVGDDGGKTWGAPVVMDHGEGNLGVSHGVFLSHAGKLWAFQGAFYDHFQRTHTRAYLLDETTGRWQAKGVVLGDGFWPMQEPQKME